MNDAPKPLGTICWTDLTVQDAEGIREFYEAVVGWTRQPVDMDGYVDYCMQAPDNDQVVAGICHARGVNANLPPQWLNYITVKDLGLSIEKCVSLGGNVLHGPRKMGNGNCAIIQDPAGACVALFEALD